jgi:hypothetical protein
VDASNHGVRAGQLVPRLRPLVPCSRRAHALLAQAGSQAGRRPNKALKLTRPRSDRLDVRDRRRDHSCWAACGQRDRRVGRQGAALQLIARVVGQTRESASDVGHEDRHRI